MKALNPSNSFKDYIKCYPGGSGEGWYRFSEIIFPNTSLSSDALFNRIEILIMQMYNFAPGWFHEISIYIQVYDEAKITSKGQNANTLKKLEQLEKVLQYFWMYIVQQSITTLMCY